MKYKVEIKETLVREVEIEAESRADAEQKIEDKWKNEEIVLSSDDFSFVNYTASPVIQKVKYTLYQLKNTEENHYIRFMGLSSTISSQINLNNYDKVYDGEYSINEPFDANKICETLFEKFNIDLPEDFRGHSLSVSDVIVLENNGENKAYYCDSIGFKEIENFLKEPDKQQDNSIDEINNDEPDICDEY